MSFDNQLKERSNNTCELCGATADLSPFLVAPRQGTNPGEYAYTCSVCKEQLEVKLAMPERFHVE